MRKSEVFKGGDFQSFENFESLIFFNQISSNKPGLLIRRTKCQLSYPY